ncbi:phage protein [Pseudomonas chlororaphis]|uniref:Phage protein n=1 Tax=Pseudomonas chlororaphis TaxID=587753 RepID=A0A3G7TKW6_9PSED|nr:phage tail assembly chaperone [Pseudomonas chlororaphis]AZE47002.1 phage protein [Pseudomonas chlororaphis]
MAIFYHLASRSFLDTATYSAKSIPADAIEITRAEQMSLNAGEASGKAIVIDEHGRPALVDPAPDPEAIANQERWWRDAELDRVKWLRERHRDELELARPTNLTADQYSELLAYMQLLRDWPQSPDFPDPAHRPVAPGWIESETQ